MDGQEKEGPWPYSDSSVFDLRVKIKKKTKERLRGLTKNHVWKKNSDWAA